MMTMEILLVIVGKINYHKQNFKINKICIRWCKNEERIQRNARFHR